MKLSIFSNKPFWFHGLGRKRINLPPAHSLFPCHRPLTIPYRIAGSQAASASQQLIDYYSVCDMHVPSCSLVSQATQSHEDNQVNCFLCLLNRRSAEAEYAHHLVWNFARPCVYRWWIWRRNPPIPRWTLGVTSGVIDLMWHSGHEAKRKGLAHLFQAIRAEWYTNVVSRGV